jgi:hypothetical protein
MVSGRVVETGMKSVLEPARGYLQKWERGWREEQDTGRMGVQG